MEKLAEILGFLILSSVKFLFAPSSVVLAGYTFWQTLLITITGGWTGIAIFFYFGGWLTGELIHYIRQRFRFRREEQIIKTRKKKSFGWKNRMIVRIRRDYGLVGLAVVTPTIISIPLGSILAARFYRHDKRTLPFLFISVCLWSLLLTSLSVLVFPY